MKGYEGKQVNFTESLPRLIWITILAQYSTNYVASLMELLEGAAKHRVSMRRRLDRTPTKVMEIKYTCVDRDAGALATMWP
jgi:hypothetical protein